MIGKRIQHYEVLDRLGAGGMGEVWLARDSKLGRDVALKVLPPHLAGDVERMGRFQREAQMLASLNHPNIGAIYGIEEADGVRCLVLELVRGETLSVRIHRGAVPLDETLSLARQMCLAIEAAHEQGVLHRDLKPGNVMITTDGTVKVLDFGLAKGFDGEASTSDLSLSPTLPIGGTMAGMILGTAAYMSPEQAKGKRVDRRADIWAFGVVLFEMLTGEQPFTGETISEVMAAVMMRDIDWSRLPKDLPTPIERLMRRCLDKDPKRRLRDIGEARLVIDDYLADPNAWRSTPRPEAAAAPAAKPPHLAWAIAAALAVAAIAAVWAPWRAAVPPPTVMELDVELSPLPMQMGYGAAAVLSPQGDRIAFVTSGEERDLYVREIGNATPRLIAGTKLAYHQFFSPDGEWIAFVTRSELKKVSVRGGSPVVLAPVSLNRGGTWGEDGTIVYSRTLASGLMRIPAAGGEPQVLTQLDSLRGESSHRWPSWIPGRNAVLFVSFNALLGQGQSRIEVVDVKSGRRKTLHEGGSQPRYSPTGHILYVHEGTLHALPFDANKLEVTGTPTPVVENVSGSITEGSAQYDLAANGTLLTWVGTAAADSVEMVRHRFSGGPGEVLIGGQSLQGIAISPDGRRAAFTRGVGAGTDVWTLDLERRSQTRMTFAENSPDWAPLWSPDGSRIAFASTQGGANLGGPHVIASDGSGSPRRLGNSRSMRIPGGWSPDGSNLACVDLSSGTWDIVSMRVDAPDSQSVLLASPASELNPQFSPDGRWLAYESNESGRFEVYVRPFPEAGGKWQVSTDGGREPRWSKRGDELFFRTEGKLRSVPIQLAPHAVSIGESVERLTVGQYAGSFSSTYDLLPDGSGAIALRTVQHSGEADTRRRVRLTFNWFERLRELTATAKK